jgi:hypothetical protein
MIFSSFEWKSLLFALSSHDAGAVGPWTYRADRWVDGWHVPEEGK